MNESEGNQVIYSANRAAKVMGVAFAIIAFIFGFLSLFIAFSGLWGLLPVVVAFFFAGLYLIDLNFRKIIIQDDNLVFKRPVFKNKVYPLASLKEIALVSLTRKGEIPVLGGSPEAFGRSLGKVAIALSESVNNATLNAQFVAKDSQGKAFFIRTN